MSRATDESYQQSKRDRDQLSVQVESAHLKKELQRLLGEVEREPGKPGASSVIDRLKEARVAAMELKTFNDVLSPSNGGEQTAQASETVSKQIPDTTDARVRLIESLARAGKSPEEIEKYLARVGPLLDMSAMARDPVGQALLYSRLGSGQNDMGVKDVVETVKLIDDMKKDSGGKSDATELAKAMVEAFKTGREQSIAANPGMSNFEAYQKGMEAMKDLLTTQNQNMQQLFQERMKHLEEKMGGNDPIAYVKQMKEAADTLGWGGQDKEIALHKLAMDESLAKMSHDMDVKNWEFNKQEKIEDRKSKRQEKMLDRIMTGVQGALESPVIREAGKMVGGKLEGKVPDVRGQAARTQLTEPMQEVREFTCPNCQRRTEFTNADLVKIANSGGRWVCTTQGCGKVYTLPKEGEVKK